MTKESYSTLLLFFVFSKKDYSGTFPLKEFSRFDSLSYKEPFKEFKEALVFFGLGTSSTFSRMACFFFLAYNAIFKAWMVNYLYSATDM